MSFRIAQTQDFQTCLDLRIRVFVQEQGIPLEEEVDALDPLAVHLLAWDGDSAVGTARVLIDGDTGKIGRICVLPQVRGAGLGRDLVLAGMDVLRQQGADTAHLAAQVPALGFYETLGFAAYGPEFDDGGIPHRWMRRPL
jgi:ElaA protein